MSQFRQRIRQSLANENLQEALDANTERRKKARQAVIDTLPDFEARRQRARAVKADVVAHLDEYLAQFIASVEKNGIIVHRARDAAEAVQVVLSIVDDSQRRAQRPQSEEKESFVPLRDLRGEKVLIAKSKSMVSEEVNINHALEAAGHRVVETDLGEYIVQLRGERPSHIITPAVHLRRSDVGALFAEKLGIPYTEDIPTLTDTARKVLREVFLTADVGFSGVNFGVAETGTLCVVTNEGNGRMCTTVPPVHIALMGMERLVPTLDDLALCLSLLPRSATGQKLSVYTSLLNGPRRPTDPDGPQERHLVILDNGRSALQASPLAEALYCLRCGACLNACPVFRELSGHAYISKNGCIAPYPGPIGSVLSPGMFNCENYGHLAQASSLCGACKEACPVDIDLPGLLLQVRAGISAQGNTEEGIGLPSAVKAGLKAFRFAAGNPGLFAMGQRLAGLTAGLVSPASGWLRIPAWTGWGYSKDFPAPAKTPFRARWDEINRVGAKGVKPVKKEGQKEVMSPAVAPAKPLVKQFTDELTALGGNVVRVREKDLPGRLAGLLKSKGIENALVDASGAKYLQGITAIHEADPSVRAGVTSAIAGIAETGSLLLTGGEGRPLKASLLPEIHVAILKISDILSTLEETLRRLEVRSEAAAVLITGPSRTADIEMTLTIGVHGPGEIHVFLVDD